MTLKVSISSVENLPDPNPMDRDPYVEVFYHNRTRFEGVAAVPHCGSSHQTHLLELPPGLHLL